MSSSHLLLVSYQTPYYLMFDVTMDPSLSYYRIFLGRLAEAKILVQVTVILQAALEGFAHSLKLQRELNQNPWPFVTSLLTHNSLEF
jgi:hypothetical protein